MAEEAATESLPELWSYGVCRDGRVFFIDDRSRTTSWLHPRTREPVNSGHMIRSDLPCGWEEGFTPEGASYFIDHNKGTTTFRHPVTGEISPENADFDLREESPPAMSPQQMNQRPHSMVSDGSTSLTTSTAEARPAPKVGRGVSKTYSFGKRERSIKRNPDLPVLTCGWLYKQDSSGMKLWKRRWFVLSDYCLFYYKDPNEEPLLGSIPLPGYVISSTAPEDRVSRKYSFKAVHAGMRAYIQQRESDHSSMRTYLFSAETHEEMIGWIRIMNQAAQIQPLQETKKESGENDWPPAPVSNHIDSFQDYSLQAEPVQLRSDYFKPREAPAETRRNSGDKERYRDAGEQGGYRETGEKERYWNGEEPGRSREFGDKDQRLHIEKDYYRERNQEPANQERIREPAQQVKIQEPSHQEHHREPAHQERHRELAHQERHREPAHQEHHREPAHQERHREPAQQEHHREPTHRERHREPTHQERHREPAQQERHQEPTHQERYRDSAYQERHRNVAHQERYRDPAPQERYLDPDPEVQYQGSREWDSYIAHKNSLNTNGGKLQNSFQSADRRSAFSDFTKSYRYPAAQTPQPQTMERNGTLPPSFRINTGPPTQQNGTDTYRRGYTTRPSNPELQQHQQGQRRSTMGQVEQWVKIQKRDGKSPMPEQERYQTLPKTSGSPPPDYKYAQDRISHLKMSNQDRRATKEGMVWQLYEWQQRQQYKHGSPTGQIYMGTLDSSDRARAKSLMDVPRCVSVPPSAYDVPPSLSTVTLFPPRRPHTPAGRLSVRPEEEAINVPYIGSPPRTRLSAVKTAMHADRRSMPSMGYITHTVSAPSLHGKSADDTYIQLKKELEYLDLKVTGRESLKDRSGKPVRIAESDVDVKLSILCEQDRILQDLEDKIRALKDNKDKLETVLEVLHRQMDQYKEQPQHTEKISYQQRLLQEDLVQIRAEMSRVSTDMETSWNEYLRLESDVFRLRQMLQEQMNRSPSAQERTQLQKELWRIEDVTAGLSSNKLNYKVLVESFKNPERKTVPLVSTAFVPSGSTAFTSVRSKSSSPQAPPPLVKQPLEAGLYTAQYTQSHSHSQPQLLHQSETSLPSPTLVPTSPKLEEGVPPRPPLPDMYSPDDPDLPPNVPPPPALPPPPRESSVIRHTSVRGLKRQSDERKRDREHGVNGDYRVELRTYVSDPELANLGSDSASPPSSFLASESGYQSLPTRGLSGSTSRLPQSSSITSYVTLRRGGSTDSSKERPRSAFERLYAGDNQRGKMSAEEQLERMKRHQKALVRERKRTLSQGDKHAGSSRPASISAPSSSRPASADVSSWQREQEFDLQLLEKAARDAEDREEEDHGWVQARAIHVTERDLEPQEYDLDISKELATPDKVEIPERYINMEPEEPLTREELEARRRKVQKIKHILTRSSVHNLQPLVPLDELQPSDLDAQMQQQERMITISYALASEASRRSKQVAAHAVTDN